MRTSKWLYLAILWLVLGVTPLHVFGAQEGPGAMASQKAEWSGDEKIFKYQGREFIVGVRNAAEKAYPLIGSRVLKEPVFADGAVPLTIQAQDCYIIYDKSKKQTIVFNIAECLKGRDATNSEKTDWAGRIIPFADHWTGDIMMLRKYDKKGPVMKAPYYSMGRDFPMTVNTDGSCVIEYNFFGKLTMNLAAREVKDELLAKIVDDFDKNYKERAPEDQ